MDKNVGFFAYNQAAFPEIMSYTTLGPPKSPLGLAPVLVLVFIITLESITFLIPKSYLEFHNIYYQNCLFVDINHDQR